MISSTQLALAGFLGLQHSTRMSFISHELFEINGAKKRMPHPVRHPLQMQNMHGNAFENKSGARTLQPAFFLYTPSAAQ
jgi:hypothetical protein